MAQARVKDLICFSHLRWGFVYQRPQHLLSRWARDGRVFFFEEPIYTESETRLHVERDARTGVVVAQPRMPGGMAEKAQDLLLQEMLQEMMREFTIDQYVAWYYTPMALGFTRNLTPQAVIYDCMDELANFAGAPKLMRERERELFAHADLIFTGGASLYEAKREQHDEVHAFPSSIDREHFAQAREGVAEPADQARLARPRIGYYGVIDERIDLQLLRELAARRPEWQIVMIGPVAKIDFAELPQAPNIHYLGSKDYEDLPAYVSGWDAAILPFALNEATRFISPTKTPEYLAAGVPAVSTPIRDVARPWGELGLVEIADGAEAFVAAIERVLALDKEKWLRHVDEQLAGNSWDATWERMMRLVDAHLGGAEHDEAATPDHSQGDE